MKITAVCGWAISPDWFGERVAHFFPWAEARAIYPRDPADAEEAGELLRACPADLYIGYSLGSLWLLRHRENLPSRAVKALLAPILAFAKERKSGGKTPVVQLKYFVKLLDRNPDDDFALKNFYASCGIPVSNSLMGTAPDRKTLVRGLEFLSEVEVPGSSAGDFLAILGEDDNFLDAVEVKRHIPHLEIVPKTGHAPEPLLNRLSELLRQNGFGPPGSQVGTGGGHLKEPF